MKVVFIYPYPETEAPSQRYRFEQFIPFLLERNIEVIKAPFWDEKGWSILYKKGHFLQKIQALLKGWIRRYRLLKGISNADFIFIHRELDPIGLPLFTHKLARFDRNKIIFDLDDAIWIPNSSRSNRFFERLKNWNQAAAIASLSGTISGGNRYLCNWGEKYASKSVLIPTTVDTDRVHNVLQSHHVDKVCVGWTGTHSTLKYLKPLIPSLEKLMHRFPNMEIKVICDAKPDFLSPAMQWIPWDKSREVEDLLQLHIGLMPLEEDAWSNGKCGFKAIQYMSLGIPAVVSPVGVNSEIVDHEVNGMLIFNEEEWESVLEELIINEHKRIEMGKKARPKIQQFYSVKAVKPAWLSLFGLPDTAFEYATKN